METVLIFAGGDTTPTSLLEELPESDLVVAADSGYDLAVAEGINVDVLIGDMDSIAAETIPSHVIVERHRTDKDKTDLELALERVVIERPARIVVVGGAGGRFDHELATAALLTSRRWADIAEIDWVTTRGWVYVIRGRRIIHADVGATIGLIPMGGAALGVTTRGLHWDLTGAVLDHGTTHGVSNVFEAPIADIKVNEGCVLAVVPG
ncbi:MAG: thiamine diphosphokinase [Acidimicrobiia bacterium]|jgi:thiamine pyrophosphokinase